VDRPFHLLIRDNITSTIAFMGRIDDPRQLQNNVTPEVIEVHADFDGDLNVNGADFLAWQRGLGKKTGAQRSEGDSNADGDVDANDLAEWMRTYGRSDSLLAAAATSKENPTVTPFETSTTSSLAELVDAAMALDWLPAAGNFDEGPVVEKGEPQPLAGTLRGGGEPIPAASAAITFDSLAHKRVDKQSDVETELEDNLLAVQIDRLCGP
jgi:hypothetical protein